MVDKLASFKYWGIFKGLDIIMQLKGLIKHNDKEIEENKLYDAFFWKGLNVQSSGRNYVVIKKDNLKILCRRFSSDLNVVQQLLIDGEFNILMQCINDKKVSIQTIIDAGGNIGISALLFNQAFSGSKLITIEPDAANFKLLVKNLSLNKVVALALNSAIWKSNCRLYFDRSFRDGREWAIALTEEPVSEQSIDAVSINDLIKNQNLTIVDLLKMDIEGGERFIFNETEQGLEFLDITKVLAIEIHDEFHIRDIILDILKQRDFEVSMSGEYVIAFNKNLI